MPNNLLPHRMKIVIKSLYRIALLLLIPLTAHAADLGIDARDYPGPAWSPYLVGAGIGVVSWLFAELSATIKQTINKWGDFGKITIADVLHLPRGVTAVVLAVFLTAAVIYIGK